jgi:hypothetical protein
MGGIIGVAFFIGMVGTISKASTGAVAILGLIFPPMTYTWFIILPARWERQDIPADLTKRAPENPWAINGITLWDFLIIQIFVYPILAAQVERYLYGTASNSRTVTPVSFAESASRVVRCCASQLQELTPS